MSHRKRWWSAGTAFCPLSGTRGVLATVDALAAVFDQCVGPASLGIPGCVTHVTLLTWGIANRVVGQLLPISKTTLQALTQELLMVGCAAGTIKNVWRSISDRHRRFGYTASLATAGTSNDCTKLKQRSKAHLRNRSFLSALTTCGGGQILTPSI
jgi:hypothetical protein